MTSPTPDIDHGASRRPFVRRQKDVDTAAINDVCRQFDDGCTAA
jgi:hypothetical protein